MQIITKPNSFDEIPLEPRQGFVMIQIQPRNSNQPGSKTDWYLVDQYITIIADDMKMANCLCICMILKSTHMPILQCLDLVIVKQVHISPESAIIVMYCSTKYQSVFDPGWFEFRANDALTATFGNNEILLKPLLLSIPVTVLSCVSGPLNQSLNPNFSKIHIMNLQFETII